MPALPRLQLSKVIQTAVPHLLQRQLAAAADCFGGGGGLEGQKKALLIGITYRYKFTERYSELQGTTSDVRELKETLISEIAFPRCACRLFLIQNSTRHSGYYGFKKEDVVVLNDEDVRTMGSETWPTRANIVSLLVSGFSHSHHTQFQESWLCSGRSNQSLGSWCPAWGFFCLPLWVHHDIW